MAELLAPAGSFDALRAAVEAGADAIYLAGKMFGARAYAANFDDEELAKAVRYAHLHNVRIYVAVNTLLDEREFSAALKYIDYLNEICVDALIIQDLGLAALVKERFPDLHLHASTQMTVHNQAGVQFLAQQGFKRVVVSREMALADIEAICHATDTEIEVFIHGALCISYSGQCLMSSMIGGRSGNRGRCAQPCRLPYKLQDKQGNDLLENGAAGNYLLSPKDLNSLRLLPEMEQAGVASFKIEGRMKKPEYVAVVVESYRKVMANPKIVKDEAACRKIEMNLAQIFNRDFTSDYLMGIKPTSDFMSHQRPNNRGIKIGRISGYDHAAKRVKIKLDEAVVKGDIIDIWVSVGGRVSLTLDEFICNGCGREEAEAQEEIELAVPQPVRMNDRVFKVFDQRLMQHAREYFEKEKNQKRVFISAKVMIEEGKPAILELSDKDGNIGKACTDFITEKAIKRAISKEIVEQQINRLGNTMFALDSMQADIQENVMVPVSELNELRRRAVMQLEEARLRHFSRAAKLNEKKLSSAAGKGMREIKAPRISIHVSDLADLTLAVDEGAGRIIFGGENFSHRFLTKEEYREAAAYCKTHKCQLIIATPKIIAAKNWDSFLRELDFAKEYKVDGVLLGNLGALEIMRQQRDIPYYADYSLNIYNSQSGLFLSRQNCAGICLSPELTFNQIGEITRNLPAALETECVVHGNLELMTSEYCMKGAFGGCKNCGDEIYYLEDRKEEHFPLVRDQYCRMHILNGKTLDMFEHVERFSELGVDWIRIDGRYKELKLKEIVRRYVTAAQRGVGNSIVENGGNNTITRGHYFRGVL